MANLATITTNILADSGIDDINVIVSTGSYSNPSWITALAWSKITGTPTTLAGYGITDAVTLGTSQTITASKSFTQGFNLASEGGTNQLSVFRNTSSLHTGSAGSNIFGFNSANNIYFGKGLSNGGVLQWNNTTLTRYYTLPDADGTIALTSQIPTNPVGGTGTTNYLPKFTGSTTIGNSNIQDNGSLVSVGVATNFSSSVAAGGLIQANGPIGSRTDTQGINFYNDNVDYRIAFDSIGGTVGYIRYNVDTAGSASHGHIFSAGDYNVTPSNLMFIRADGNIGINTTFSGINSPSQLTIKASIADGNQIYLVQSNDDRGWKLKAQTDGHFYLQSAYTSSGSNVLKACYDTGNVLIGAVSDAGFKLDVNGTGRFSGQLTGNSWFNVANTFGLTIRNAANTAFRTAVQMNSSNVLIFGQDSDITALTFGVGSEAMRITSSGNVGIGTTSPDVFGRFYTQTLGLSSSGSTAIQINGGSGGYGQIDFGAAGVRTAGISASANETQWGSVTSIPAIIYTNGSERMRITSSGNVLIGTTTDAGFKLDVNGTGRFSGALTVSGTSTLTGRVQAIEIGVTRNGADTIGDGPWYRWTNAAQDRQMLTQLNASNGLTTWAYNGSTWTSVYTLTQSGAATFSTTSGNGITIVTNDVTTLKMNSTSGTTKNWGFATTNLAASDFGIYQSTSNGGDAISAGTPRLYFSGVGNVGIGTSSPGTNLHIEGGSVSYGQVRIKSTGAIGGETSIHYGRTTQTLEQGWTVGQGVASIQNDFGFYTGGSVRLLISTSGNVLIGTSTDVGSVRLQVAPSAVGWISQTIAGAGGTNKVVIGNYNGLAAIGGHNSALSAWAPLAINFDGGNVLIGTTSDVGATLHVNGTIRTGAPSGGSAVNWRLGTARGGTVTTNATVRVEIDGVLVDLVARYV